MAPITTYPRFTFGFDELDAGISLLPALIGLFAVLQVLEQAESRSGQNAMRAVSYRIRGFGLSPKQFGQQTGNLILSSSIGTAIGILPGLAAWKQP